jgi:hypothetical protein
MRTGIVVALLAVIALAFLNPSMDDFALFAETHAENLILQETGDTMLGRALSGAGGNLAGEYVKRITERDNYLIFSTYTIDFDGSDSDEEDWEFLGIAGRFVELERPESMRESSGD